MMLRWTIALGSVLAAVVSCGAPETLKVGFLAGLTGSFSQLGIEARRSLELSVADVNQKGGVRGRPLELVVQDDGNDSQQGLEAYRRFTEQGVVAVVGPMASSVVGPVLPFLNEHHVLTISPTVSAVSVSGQIDWFYRVITSNRAMGETLGAYAVDQGFDDVAVLRETSNDAYTGPFLEAFRQVMQSEGRRVRPAVEFDLRGSPNYERLVRELGAAPAYLVLANGYDTAQVGQKLAQAGRLQPLLAPPWAMTNDVISLGGRQVERMVFVSVYDSQSLAPAWREFRDAYWQRYGEQPGFAALYTHDALTLLTRALTRAASLAPDDLRAAVEAVGEVEGLQGTFHLDSQGDVVRQLTLLTVREGQFVRWSP